MDMKNRQNPLIICSPQYGDLIEDPSVGGGVQDFETLRRLAQFQDTKIHILLARGRKASEKLTLCKIHFFSPAILAKSYLFNLIMLPKLWQVYRETNFSILRIHSPYFVGIGAWIFKKFHPRVQTAAVYHHIEKNPVFHIIDLLFINSWDIIFVPSENTKKELLQKYKVDSEKIVVIFNGIDESLAPQSKNQEFLKKLGLPSNDKILVFSGKVIPRKNVSFLAGALEALNKKYALLPTLLIAGPVDGDYKQELISKAATKNVEKQIVFLGQFPNAMKTDLYNSADLFVFPSLQEGFGLAPVEAMTCAKTVIASDRGALPEVIGEYGFILPLSEELWADKIKELLENENLRNDIGKKAREHVLKNFSWDNNAKIQYNAMRNMLMHS